MSIAITALLLVTVAALFLYGVKADREGTFFMSKDFTTTMKGLAAIVVVFVHFPTEYQNKLQDLVGSFAYVAVTVFFLFSAYGMLLSVDRNERYLKTFWINRIAGLVVPNWMVNFALAAIIFLFASKSVEMDNVFQLNTYVWVLLGYCVVFYLVELMSKRYRLFSRRIADGLLMASVVFASFATYFLCNETKSYWCYERFGLLWGILLLRYLPQIRQWLSSKRVAKIVVLTLISGILGICYLKYKEVWFYGEFILKVALGLAIILWLFICAYRLRISNAVTRFLGDISFEIYLSHYYIMGTIAYFMPGLDSGLFIWATFIATIAFSAALHQLNRRLIALIRR